MPSTLTLQTKTLLSTLENSKTRKLENSQNALEHSKTRQKNEGVMSMRRPALNLWVGLAFGIMAVADRIALWLALGTAAGISWVVTEPWAGLSEAFGKRAPGASRGTALLLVFAAFWTGFGLMARQSHTHRTENPVVVTAVGYVDRYSALSEEKLIYCVSVHDGEDKGLPETFRAVIKPEVRLEVGRYYRMTLSLQSAALPRNPGMFDYRQYLDSRGIGYLGTIARIENTEQESHWSTSLREQVRQEILKRLLAGMGEEAGQLAAAMILGDTADLDPELLAVYRQTGTAHILAVSGLHFGILFSGAEIAFDRLKLPYKVKKTGLLVLVLVFLGLVGLKSSAMRAAGMLILAVVLQASGRPYDRLNVLGLVGAGLLAFRPVLLFDVGYQMSMAAVYGIAAIMPALIKPSLAYNNEEGRSGFKLLHGAALSLSVLAATALPAAVHFNTLTLISVLVNLPVVFLTGMALPLAFITVLASPLPGIPELTGWCSAQILQLIEVTVRFAENAVHQPSIVVATPGSFTAGGIAGALGLFALRRQRTQVFAAGRQQLAAAALLITVIVCSLPVEGWLQPVDRVRYFDVGQGDAALLQTRGGENILIDTGDGRAFREMDQLLLKTGVSRLDLMVLTHPHLDHTGGAEAVLKRLKVGALVISAAVSPETYGSLIPLAQSVGAELLVAGAGDQLELKNSRLQVLSPFADSHVSDPNEASLVLLFISGEIAFLFTGDITARQEYAIIDGIPDLKTILKVAHHGSKTSSDGAFITSLKPGVAVISVGRNSFGHPGAKTLETLKQSGFATFRTDESGCVEIKTNGTAVYLRRFMD